MNTRNFLATSLYLFALSSFAPLPLLAQQPMTDATLTVCNKGQININVVVGTQAALPLFNHDLIVAGWTSIEPGACRQVYHDAAVPGYATDRAYVGFGFLDPRGQLIAGHASRLPDLGTFSFGTPVLTAAGDRFCVRRTSAFEYRIAEHAQLNCATFRAGANDPGGYTSFPTALEIQPLALACAQFSCSYGYYSLDVTATRANPEIQITGRIGDQPDQSAGSGGPGVGTQILQQLAKAAAEQGQKLAQERAAAAAQVKLQDEKENDARWAGTRQSPAAYGPKWMGQNMVIVGTVSRVEIDATGSPQWVSIYFKESPDATFVLCSPYADMFQERVGRNLNALVGKTLEAAGQVESPYCGGKAPKGSIRVVESKQWQVH